MENKILKKCTIHGDLTIDKLVGNESTYRCKMCNDAKNKKYREANREKLREAAKIYQRQNRDRINAYVREDRKKNPEKYREYEKKLREKYGERANTLDIVNYFKLTMEEYENLFLTHNNLCAICKKPEIKKSRTPGKICRLAVDHCHFCWEKGTKGIKATRGLLCHECNIGIGKFKDNIELLEKAVEYLKKHKHVE